MLIRAVHQQTANAGSFRKEHHWGLSSVSFAQQVGGSISHTGWGGAAGLGFEYGVTPNWTVGLEWDHLFMGDRTFNLANAGLIFANDQITHDVDLIMVRVNYKFGGPVVARF